MEFIKLSEDRYMINNSNNYVVSEEEMLKLKKNELVLKDISGCDCQQETTKKISKINKRLKDVKPVEETNTTTE